MTTDLTPFGLQRVGVTPFDSAATSPVSGNLAPTTSLLDPISFPQAYDFATIAGVQTPGIIPPGGVSGAERAYKFDTKEGKGTVGSTVTFTNKPPSPFSIKLLFWIPQHFEDWNSFTPLLKYDPTKKTAQAFDIYHPVLAALEIKSVVCTKIGVLTNDGDGLWSVSIEFLEYFPASKTSAVSTPNGSKPDPDDSGPGNKPDPEIQAAQKQIDDLTKDAQKP